MGLTVSGKQRLPYKAAAKFFIVGVGNALFRCAKIKFSRCAAPAGALCGEDYGRQVHAAESSRKQQEHRWLVSNIHLPSKAKTKTVGSRCRRVRPGYAFIYNLAGWQTAAVLMPIVDSLSLGGCGHGFRHTRTRRIRDHVNQVLVFHF